MVTLVVVLDIVICIYLVTKMCITAVWDGYSDQQASVLLRAGRIPIRTDLVTAIVVAIVALVGINMIRSKK